MLMLIPLVKKTENDNEKFFDKDFNDEVEVTSQTTINAKMVRAMKKLQSSYNNGVNKIVEQAMKEKSAIKNLNFLINLTMMTIINKPVPEEPITFNKAWDRPNKNF